MAGEDVVAKDLIVRLTAEYEKFKQENMAADKSFSTMTKSVESKAENMRKVSLAFTAVGAGITAAFGLSVKGAMDFNRAMGNVETMIPGNTARMNELKTAIQKMAVDVGKSTGDLAEGAYQVISAFGDTADTVKILGTAAKAAKAGVASTTDAINLLSAVTKGYGDTSADAVQSVADLAFQTVKLGQTTFPELAGAIGRVTGLSAELGLTQQELFASFATLTGVTGNAAEVSTQLKAVLVALMNPTEDMQKLMDKLGVANGKAFLKAYDFKGVLDEIKKAADGTDGNLQKFLGSTEAVTIALGLSGKLADQYVTKLGDMDKANGAATEALNAQETGVNQLGAAWDKMVQGFAVIQQKIGDVLTPAIVKAGSAVKDFMVATVDFIDRHPDLTAGLVAGGVAFGGLMLAAGGAGLAIASIKTLLTSLGLAAGPAGWVVLGIVAVSAAIGAMVANWDTVGPAISGAYDWLVKLFNQEVVLGEFGKVLIDTNGMIADSHVAVWGEGLRLNTKFVTEGIAGVLNLSATEQKRLTDLLTKTTEVATKQKEEEDTRAEEHKAMVEGLKAHEKQLDDIRGKEQDDFWQKQLDDYDTWVENIAIDVDKVEVMFSAALTAEENATVRSLKAQSLEWQKYGDYLVGADRKEQKGLIGEVRGRYEGFLTDSELKTVERLAKMGKEWQGFGDSLVKDNGLFSRLKFGFQNTMTEIGKITETGVKGMGTVFLSEMLQGDMKKAREEWKRGWDNMIDNVTDSITSKFTSFIVDKVKDIGKAFWNALSEGKGGFLDSITNTVAGVVNSIAGASGGSAVTNAAGGAATAVAGGGAAAAGGGVMAAVGSAALTAGIGLAIAGAIYGLTKLFSSTPPSEKRRRDDANDALPAVVGAIEKGVKAGKMSEAEAEWRIDIVNQTAQSGEILNFLLSQNIEKARRDYYKGDDMSKHSATRAKALWQWMDETWANAGNTVGMPLSMASFHSGGVVNGVLGQEKVVKVLAGEEVLTRSDPRHALNMSGGINISLNVGSISPETDLRGLAREVGILIVDELRSRSRAIL